MIAILARGWLTLSNCVASGPGRRQRHRLGSAAATLASSDRDCLVRLCIVAIYAAYGSNMDPAQMARRCPHSPQEGTGWLEGWRLTFGGEDIGWQGALATVVEDEGESRLRRPL